MEGTKTFRDLLAWSESHKLVLLTYRLTESFPSSEKFALSDQLKRAAVSITSNTAEGYSRKTAKDKSQFYQMSLGSLTEVHSQLLTACDLGYISSAEMSEAEPLIEKSHKLLNGLIKATRESRFVT